MLIQVSLSNSREVSQHLGPDCLINYGPIKVFHLRFHKVDSYLMA